MSQVQGVGNDNGGTATATLVGTFSAATTPGNALYVAMGYSGGTCTVAHNGQSIPSKKKSSADGNGYFVEEFELSNITGGTTTVTATFSPSQIGIIIASEESGIALTSEVDGTPNSATNASSTAWGTGGTTTLNANDVLYCAAMGTTSPSTTNTAFGGGFSAITGTGLTSGYRQNTGDGDVLVVGRQEVAATSTYTGSGTWAAAQLGSGVIIALKKSSGVSGPTPPMARQIYVMP